MLYTFLKGYLDTCSKNDVISFSRKRFCALGLELELEVRVRVGVIVLGLELTEIRLNTFSVKRLFGQMS